MRQEKQPVDRYGALDRAKKFIAGGIAVGVIGAFAVVLSGFLTFLLVIAAAALILYGASYGHSHCVCPSCGAFLGESGRLPPKLPGYCPTVGRSYSKTRRSRHVP